jgi:hypothetical protein
MARTPFKLRSQGQPFKMIGATQPVQPVQPPQQDPVQPLYSNPNDPAMQQQQRAPLQQIVTPSTLDWDLNSDKKDDDRVSLNSDNKDNRLSLTQNGKKASKVAQTQNDSRTKKVIDKAKEDKSDDLNAASENTEAAPEEEAAPDAKKKRGNKFLKAAADIITGGLDRVYGSGKTNLLANEKAAEYAAQKSEEAKKALAEKRAHELEVIKLGGNKKAKFTTEETDEQKAERERKEKLARTTNAIDGTSPAAYKSPAKQVDPSMIMGLVGGMGGGKKEEEKKEQPNWKANVKVSE